MNRWPPKIPAAQQMQMQMKHGLSRAASIVDDGAVAIGEFALPASLAATSCSLPSMAASAAVASVSDTRCFRGQIRMWSRRLGMDILEREYFGVLVHEFRWNFLASNFAEQAIVHKQNPIRKVQS